MKHLLFAVAILLTFHFTVAQTRYAVKAGWNLSTAFVSDDGIKQPADFKNGFGIAFLCKIPFENALHFSPYLGYSMRGFAYHPLNPIVISKYDYTIHYIDIVPALSYDIPIHENTLVISLGPQFGVALSGKEKLTNLSDSTVTRNMKFATDGNFGLIDAGLSSSLAFHLKKVFFEAGFQLGLTNINNNVDVTIQDTYILIDPRNMRLRMFSLNIGYYLN